MQLHVEFRHKSYLFLQKENQNLGGYTCLVKAINFDGNSDKITIIGDHQANETNESVLGVTIRKHSQLQKFPRGFGEIFPNLKYFEIDGSSITQLRKEDLLDLGHLQGFWMPRNQIVALPNDLFMNVQGLRYLSFHHNKLKFIGHHILNPLKNLQRANFLENTTINLAFNGKEGELDALNNEISLKCMSPMTPKLGPSDSGKVVQLEIRVQMAEDRIVKLESEKEAMTAELSQQITSQQKMIEGLQDRLSHMENYFI